VRVPGEAGRGKVKITLSFPDRKEIDAAPLTLEVTIGEPPASNKKAPNK
jgi:hypothetical protein